MSESKGKIVVIASNRKGFKIEGDEAWFNAPSEELLKGFAKGDIVILNWDKDKSSRKVTNIAREVVAKPAVQTVVKESGVVTGPVCNVCGKVMKNDKFKTCFLCNKQGLKPAGTVETPKEETKSTYQSKSNYGSPEDVAGKEVGCAANCASAILAGRQEDPATLLEMFRLLCDGILDHIRTLK
jgi:hypothetical protein